MRLHSGGSFPGWLERIHLLFLSLSGVYVVVVIVVFAF